MSPEETMIASGNAGWMLTSASLVLLMTPALAMFYGGMTSRRAALNMMLMSFGALGVVALIYVLWGWSMSYGTQSWGGIVANPFEFFGLRNSIVDAEGNYIAGSSGYANIIDVGFQLTFAVISTAIISGALAERVKFSTWLVFSGLWATFAYFPLAHMVWGGGLLSHGENSLAAWMFGTTDGEATISPIDFAGGTVVHISAGTAALVLAFVVGRRRTFPTGINRPHNLPLVMTGAALLWFGWFGFNGGSAFAADGLAGLAWLNTTVATAAAMIGWLVVERIRFGGGTSLGAASGIVAGLVTITPAAGDVHPLGALLLGLIGGGLASFAIGLKFRFGFDDSLDVVGIHLVAGLWGTIGLAFVSTGTGIFTGGGADGWRLLIVQAVIAVVAMIFSGAVTLIIALILKATMDWRVDKRTELEGIDRHQHRESGYDIAGEGSRGSQVINLQATKPQPGAQATAPQPRESREDQLPQQPQAQPASRAQEPAPVAPATGQE